MNRSTPPNSVVSEARPSSPYVMLSPNARNFVRRILGGAVTVTVTLQLDVRCWASVAVQVTVVAPSGNVTPLAGVHDVVIGDAPPATDGGL